MPASAVLVQVADAVVALLNTPGAFSQSFTAKRSYPTWKIPLTKLGPLRVDVVPIGHPTTALDTRDSGDLQCRVVVVVRRKLVQGDRKEESEEGRPISNEAVDALIALVEEIYEFLCGPDARRLTSADGLLAAAWMSTQITTTYIDKQLQDNGQFTAMIRVTYGVSIDL
jgi:hypothetical protein